MHKKIYAVWATAFSGPVRVHCKLFLVKSGNVFCRVTSRKNAHYKCGEEFNIPAHEIFTKHRSAGYKSIYVGRPDLRDIII